MPVSNSFKKHGTFIYEVGETVADYGTNQFTIDAMKRAGMTHAWVRIHGRTAYGTASRQRILQFIDDLRANSISVAGWGWCQGENPVAEAALALKELDRYGLTDYVADIEHGTSNANWTSNEIKAFCTRIKKDLSGSFGITTYPLIDWHEPQLMQAAVPFVDMFNPQVYWFHFPDKKMVKQFKRPNGKTYTTNNSAEYAELCLDRWDALLGGSKKDLVITGAAYWGEGNTETDANNKVVEFLDGWKNFKRVIGLNWWHFGGKNAMSHHMLETIVAANLASKNYA
jgi:hypothetical protein